MKKELELLALLKERGHRDTRARRVLLELFVANDKPLSVPDLLKAFTKRRLSVNKTTVYRELAFLEEQGIVTPIRLNERQVRYELGDEHTHQHHHHLVCTSCDRVEDVVLPGDLMKEETRIEAQTRFTIQRHVLEFFGTCAACQS